MKTGKYQANYDDRCFVQKMVFLVFILFFIIVKKEPSQADRNHDNDVEPLKVLLYKAFFY